MSLAGAAFRFGVSASLTGRSTFQQASAALGPALTASAALGPALSVNPEAWIPVGAIQQSPALPRRTKSLPRQAAFTSAVTPRLPKWIRLSSSSAPPFLSVRGVRAMASAAAGAVGLEEVQGSVKPNGVAVISLHRPKALNAMNLEMDKAYRAYLDTWAADPAVKAVLVEGSQPRAFCSGLDVKWFSLAIKADPQTLLVPKVFQAEYSLICAIARYRKPYVSLMDGITMGFGLGLSGHGRYRVITERSLLAMPENAIGLFPDVGFAHIIAKAPGGLGTYLGLTGARLRTPADILYAGLATHFVSSANLPALRQALLEAKFADGNSHATVESILARFAEQPAGPSELAPLQPAIDRCFGGGREVRDTLAALAAEEKGGDAKVAEWAREALAGMQRGAPFSLSLTQVHFDEVATAVRAGRGELKEVEGTMHQEYRLALRSSVRPDFVEGVRATLVDKDQNPQWQPKALDEVSKTEVLSCFAPFTNGSEELKARM